MFRRLATACVGFVISVLTVLSFGHGICAWATTPTDFASISAPVVVYNTGQSGCDPGDVPDAPARAFRDADGVVHLFAAGSIDRAMLGRQLGHTSRSCRIVFKGAKNKDPAAYDDNGWLTAFWAKGNTVYALVHNEFHARETPDLCTGAGTAECTEIAITGAVSRNGGLSFTRVSGDAGLVAALPYPFEAKAGAYIGLMNPSSIIEKGGFYYVLISQIDPYDRSKSGVCLFRTATLSEPNSWHGWEGSGFSTTALNPYRVQVASPTARLCAPVSRDVLFFSLGSLAWLPEQHSYLLVMRFQIWDTRPGFAPGAYLFESQDLIHWSQPRLLLSDAAAGGQTQLYPSLIDPAAQDQNFSTVGHSATLYTVVTGDGPGFEGWTLLARHVTFK